MVSSLNPGPHEVRRAWRWIVGVLLGLVLLDAAVRAAVEILWFQELGTLPVLMTRWGSELACGLAGFAVAFSFLLVNALVALGGPASLRLGPRGAILSPRIHAETRSGWSISLCPSMR